ncbi:hypothetical protein D3C72_1894360 [compost metagenome]
MDRLHQIVHHRQRFVRRKALHQFTGQLSGLSAGRVAQEQPERAIADMRAEHAGMVLGHHLAAGLNADLVRLAVGRDQMHVIAELVVVARLDLGAVDGDVPAFHVLPRAARRRQPQPLQRIEDGRIVAIVGGVRDLQTHDLLSIPGLPQL